MSLGYLLFLWTVMIMMPPLVVLVVSRALSFCLGMRADVRRRRRRRFFVVFF